MPSLQLEQTPTQQIPDAQALAKRWQDNWPAIAYDVDYDHQSNLEYNPQTIADTLSDVGVPKGNIPSTEVVIANPARETRRGITQGRSGISPDSGNQVIVLHHQADPHEAVSTLIHEGTHVADRLNGVPEPMLNGEQRRWVGRIAAVGALAVKTFVDYKIGMYDQLNPITAMAGLSTAMLGYSLPRIGAYQGYRLGSNERRAFKAQENDELINKHAPNLFTS